MVEFWQECRDEESGDYYYFNIHTKETQWRKPMILLQRPELGRKAANPSPVSWNVVPNTKWKIVRTDTREEYYYNMNTGITTWDIPEEVEEYKVIFFSIFHGYVFESN